jgi:hypothetical protein
LPFDGYDVNHGQIKIAPKKSREFLLWSLRERMNTILIYVASNQGCGNGHEWK